MKKNILLTILALFLLQACLPKTTEQSSMELQPGVVITAVEPMAVVETQAIQESSILLTDGSLNLTIVAPSDNSIVKSSPLEIHGTTNTETVLTVNGLLYLLAADQDFTSQVDLEEGYNTIELVASDYEGNQVEMIITIIYEM